MLNNNLNLYLNSNFISLIEQLNRDISLINPIDPLQFCSSWFQFKLEQERFNLIKSINHQQQQQQQQQQHQPLNQSLNQPLNQQQSLNQQHQSIFQPNPINPFLTNQSDLNSIQRSNTLTPSILNSTSTTNTNLNLPQSHHSSNQIINPNSALNSFHHQFNHQSHSPLNHLFYHPLNLSYSFYPNQFFNQNHLLNHSIPSINQSFQDLSHLNHLQHHLSINQLSNLFQNQNQINSNHSNLQNQNQNQIINPSPSITPIPLNHHHQPQFNLSSSHQPDFDLQSNHLKSSQNNNQLTTPTRYLSPATVPSSNLNQNLIHSNSNSNTPISPAPTYNTHQPSPSPKSNPINNSTSNITQSSSSLNLNQSNTPDSSSDESNTEPSPPKGYNFSRRVSVSAESLSPSNNHNGPAPPKVYIPKTIEQRKRIEASIKDNLLFRNLDEEQHNDVLNAMSEVRVGKGTEVIVQGAVGDFFYVVEEGTFDVYVRGPPTYTYIPPSSSNNNQINLTNNSLSTSNPFGSTSNSSNQDHSISSIQRGSTPSMTGTTLTHQAPSKKVHTYGPGGSFGELALMYNAPRAATVVATSPSATLWALDRVTFRSILMEHTARKRKMYENFLSEVPILVSLSPTERSKIADSLEERSFAEGVAVVQEGEVGREFFIIESGRAEVSKKRANGEAQIVGLLGKGDHFGELALLNSAPRAATVRAAPGSGRLRVAALGEKAFTRLLGPVVDILSRHAESHYGKNNSTNHHLNHPNQNNSITTAGTSNGNQLESFDNIESPTQSPHSSLPPPGSSSSNTSSLNHSYHQHGPNGLNNTFAGWNGLNGGQGAVTDRARNNSALNGDEGASPKN